MTFRKKMFDANDFLVVSKIAKGGFSTIYKAENKTNGQVVAIKAINKDTYGAHGLESFLNEVNIMKHINHVRVVKYITHFEDDYHFCIVMEYVRGRSLLDMVNASNGLSEATCRKIMTQMLDAVEFMHNVIGVVHRDIKLDNIMIDEFNNVKIIDFGLAVFHHDYVDPPLSNMCGSMAYASPEMLSGKKYNSLTDIWSLGIVLYAMVTGRLPFFSENDELLVGMIIDRPIVIPKILTTELSELIKLMLNKEPQYRISIKELSDHPWLAHRSRFSNLSTSTYQISQSPIKIRKKLVRRLSGECSIFEPTTQLCGSKPIYRINNQII